MSGFKDTTVYEEKVSQLGEHYYQPYFVGALLGRGGFAYCHEVKTLNDNNKYAIKIIPKLTDVDAKKKRDIALRVASPLLRFMRRLTSLSPLIILESSNTTITFKTTATLTSSLSFALAE
jgi:hypothetical protein